MRPPDEPITHGHLEEHLHVQLEKVWFPFAVCSQSCMLLGLLVQASGGLFWRVWKSIFQGVFVEIIWPISLEHVNHAEYLQVYFTCTYILDMYLCGVREKILNSVNSKKAKHQLILKVLKNNKRLQIFKEVLRILNAFYLIVWFFSAMLNWIHEIFMTSEDIFAIYKLIKYFVRLSQLKKKHVRAFSRNFCGKHSLELEEREIHCQIKSFVKSIYIKVL